jgi:hypothetical protein
LIENFAVRKNTINFASLIYTDMTRNELESIMDGNYVNVDGGMTNVIRELSQYAKVSIPRPDGSDYMFMADVEELLANGVDEQVLVDARAAGWSLSKDKSFIFQKF